MGGPLAPVTQACFGMGGGAIVTFDMELMAHHMGHFEFKACHLINGEGEITTQECLESHPLT